jgi:hypothetical protein
MGNIMPDLREDIISLTRQGQRQRARSPRCSPGYQQSHSHCIHKRRGSHRHHYVPMCSIRLERVSRSAKAPISHRALTTSTGKDPTHSIRQNPIRSIRVGAMQPQLAHLTVRHVANPQPLRVDLRPKPFSRDGWVASDERSKVGGRVGSVSKSVRVPWIDVRESSIAHEMPEAAATTYRRTQGRRRRVVEPGPDLQSRGPRPR